MEDEIILFKKGSYDKAAYVTYATKSYPKNDGSGRWIVEYYDVYADNTSELTRAAECDEDRVCFVTYLLAK